MMWSNYEYQPSFVLGFHGCEREIGENILSGKIAHLKFSKKKYDWLGSGIYFWEGDPLRAEEWAQERKGRGVIKDPFVLGAIIDLRHCFDLFSRTALMSLRDAHHLFCEVNHLAGDPMPTNNGPTPDNGARNLDCAVMNYYHFFRKQTKQRKFDTVRSPFLEGGEVYPTAGFREKTHIQICVRNTACIKGYFRPIERSSSQLPTNPRQRKRAPC